MDQEIIVTLLMHVKEDSEGRFLRSIPDIVLETTAAPGVRSVRAFRQNADVNAILFIEEWESEQAFNDYIAWRTERGDMEQLKQVLSKAPEINVWHSATLK